VREACRTMTDESIIFKLAKALLDVSVKSVSNPDSLFSDMTAAVLSVSDCVICSLWGTNTVNSTNAFEAMSLIARAIKKDDNGKAIYDFKNSDNNDDYVYELNANTFTQKVIDNKKSLYYLCKHDECSKEMRTCCVHKSPECINVLGIRYILGIPIRDKQEKVLAVLKLSFQEKPLNGLLDEATLSSELLESFAKIVQDYVLSQHSQYSVAQKQFLLSDLMGKFQEKGAKKLLRDILMPVIPILFKYCPCEGASFFVWDYYQNRYQLIATTGIMVRGDDDKTYLPKDYSEVFYELGEGLTGKCAEEKRIKIFSDFSREYKSHKGKSEETNKKGEAVEGKTIMFVPIFAPTGSNKDVIGILRLKNKLNHQNPLVIDYFNETDEDIITYATRYLALTIANKLSEDTLATHISTLAHEYKEPTNAIFKSVDRLLKFANNTSRREEFLESYLVTVLKFTSFLKYIARTNLVQLKVRNTTIPKSKRYVIQRTSLNKIFRDSKMLVIPIARHEGLKFDNIEIEIPTPSREYFSRRTDVSSKHDNVFFNDLFVDEDAFVSIFANLLINAIKYRRKDPESAFSIKIKCGVAADHIIIHVEDGGLGIAEEDTEKIFMRGNRGRMGKTNVSGAGLGLYTARQIIEDFGGKISVFQCLNPTIFEIRLPKKLQSNAYTKEYQWTRTES